MISVHNYNLDTIFLSLLLPTYHPLLLPLLQTIIPPSLSVYLPLEAMLLLVLLLSTCP
jgi:hypothetical protein